MRPEIPSLSDEHCLHRFQTAGKALHPEASQTSTMRETSTTRKEVQMAARSDKMPLRHIEVAPGEALQAWL